MPEEIQFTPEQETEINNRISKSLEDYKTNNPPLNLESAVSLVKKSGGNAFLSDGALSDHIKPMLEEKATSILGNYKGDVKKQIRDLTGIEWEEGETDPFKFLGRALSEYEKKVVSKSGDNVNAELLGVKGQLEEAVNSKTELEEKLKLFVSEKRDNEISSMIQQGKSKIALDGDYYRDDETMDAVMSKVEKSFYDQYEIEQTEKGYIVKNKSNGAAMMNGQEIKTIESVFTDFVKGLDNVKFAQGGGTLIPGSGGQGATKEQISTAINKAVETHKGKSPMHRDLLKSVKELGGEPALREYLGNSEATIKQAKERFPELA